MWRMCGAPLTATDSQMTFPFSTNFRRLTCSVTFAFSAPPSRPKARYWISLVFPVSVLACRTSAPVRDVHPQSLQLIGQGRQGLLLLARVSLHIHGDIDLRAGLDGQKLVGPQAGGRLERLFVREAGPEDAALLAILAGQGVPENLSRLAVPVGNAVFPFDVVFPEDNPALEVDEIFPADEQITLVEPVDLLGGNLRGEIDVAVEVPFRQVPHRQALRREGGQLRAVGTERQRADRSRIAGYL